MKNKNADLDTKPDARGILYMTSFFLFVYITLSWTIPGISQDVASTWKFESQRKQIEPGYSIDTKNTFNGKPTLILNGGGKEHADGHWYKVVSVTPGEYFQFRSYYQSTNVDEPKRSILARVIWLDESGKQVGFTEYPLTLPDKSEEGWNVFEQHYKIPAETKRAKLELHYRWDADGSVRFSDVTFQKAAAPEPRLVRLATIHHRPSGSKSAMENLQQFSTLIAKAGAQKADIVCLPEALTMVGTKENYVSASEPIPGPSTEFLGSVAAKHNLYIVAGLLEKEGDVVYNTAVLIDRQGKLAGKYRKVSLPREEIDGGITPGNSFPVFDTDFGKIGMMICWDVTFPDAAKTLALNGADVILMPIAGGYIKLAMARALENQVYLVSSTYDMISAVFDLEGNVLAEATKENPVAVVEVDLNTQKLWPWIGDLKSRIPREMPSQKSLERLEE